MAYRAVQISFDVGLLERIDADPQVKSEGRSAFVCDAVLLYLRFKERRELDEQIQQAYDGQAAAMLADVEGLLGTQPWPDA